ncbi:transient receptor potential cation channel subfamily M member 2-like [Ptychodera flava]|uniref:transient receptor potential cation channel subfamily M member 2-like n=1 Tax=Ptychodera flava TaxID=63121 RepID=UPI00396A0D45
MTCLRRQDSVASIVESEEETDGLIQRDHEGSQKELLNALKENRTGKPTQAMLKGFGKENFNHFARNHLSTLYQHTVLGEECPLWLQDIAIENIMQHESDSREAREALMTSVGNFICNLLPLQFQRRAELGDMYISSTERHYNEAPVYGTRDVFLWAILSYRLELAMDIFNNGWPEYDRPSLIGASLTACKILNKLADIAKETAREKSLELDSSARKYKSIANFITSECFKENRKKTRQMVLHRRLQWGNESFLVISSFLEGDESESFRIVLDDLWTGRLKFSRYLKIKLILAIFPLFAFILRVHDERQVSCYNFPAKWTAYYTAPITKFMYNSIFFIFHLLAFSYFLMTDFHHGSNWYTISIWEKLVTIWVFGMTVEELRQMITVLKGNDVFDCLAHAWEHYMSDWNSIDWTMLLLFHAGFIVRLTIDEERFYIARVLYTLSLIIMFFRFLRFAIIWQYLGPKIEMIRLMTVRDLPPFLMIFVVYFISFGIAYRVLLFPNDVFSLNAVLAVFSVPFWQTFGYMQLEMTEDTPGCTTNISLADLDPDIERCPETQGYPLLVPILIGIFLIMSNILLLNIVIAVFNQTYGSVEEESAKIHRSNHYSLVEEYIARPILPSPLNMLELLIIRPLATLVICMYWSCTKKTFRCRPHSWKLFRLLMAGKEVDPPLWERVYGDRHYRYSRRISQNIVQVNALEQSQQTADRHVVTVTRQTSGFDQVTPQQIQQIFRKLHNTESQLRALQQGMDHILTELSRSRRRRRDSHSSVDETQF